jgi:hypothetical protein
MEYVESTTLDKANIIALTEEQQFEFVRWLCSTIISS